MVEHLDLLVALALYVVGAAVSLKWRRARPAVALASSTGCLYFVAKAVAVLVDCFSTDPSGPDAVADAARAAARPRRRAFDAAAPPTPPSPPPAMPSGQDCGQLETVWPVALVGIAVVVAFLQVCS